MKPVIISFDCTDYDPIDTWVFSDSKHVDFWMNFTIGPDSQGGNNFQLHVLTSNMLNNGTSLKSAVVLEDYSWDALLEKIDEIIELCSGSDWEEVCSKMANHMDWEYDNYQP